MYLRFYKSAFSENILLCQTCQKKNLLCERKLNFVRKAGNKSGPGWEEEIVNSERNVCQ